MTVPSTIIVTIMTAKFVLVGFLAFGASIGAAHATEGGSRSHSPLAGVELGERLSKPIANPAETAAPKAEPAAINNSGPATQAERKVRVVYPFPR